MTALHLIISTPLAILVDEEGVTALRAEDATGSFGVLRGHADLLTVLPASILRWRDASDRLHFCALRGGVLSVDGGREVKIACREAVLGDDLDRLTGQVAAMRDAEQDASRRARVQQTHLHARAVRQLMRYLRPDAGLHIEDLDAEEEAS